MASRCPSCNKFAGFDDDEPEANLTIEGDQLTGTLSLVQNSACCGDELRRAEASVEVELDLPEDKGCVPPEDSWCAYCKVASENSEKCPGEGCDNDFSDTEHQFDESDVEVSLKSTKGGTATFSLSGTLTCQRCGLEVEVDGTAEGELEESC